MLLLVHFRMPLGRPGDHVHESHLFFSFGFFVRFFILRRAVSGVLRIGLRHIFAMLGLAIPVLAFVVVDLRIGVYPNLAVASARSRGCGIALRQIAGRFGAPIIGFGSAWSFWFRSFAVLRSAVSPGLTRWFGDARAS